MKKFKLQLILILSVITLGLTTSSCVVESGDDSQARWFLSGTWQCMQYPDETLCFYDNGTGHWENNYSGDYEDFSYYCYGNTIEFQWYPSYGPSYYEDCTIYVANNNAIQITYPPRDGYGPTTLYYSRIY